MWNIIRQSNQSHINSFEEVKKARKPSLKDLNYNIDMPKSYQFENKSNEFAFKWELNPHENKMFESIPDINSKSKVVPFKEYSNASKVMKSSNSKEDEIMKFSNKQPNFLNSNYNKQRDSLKNNEKFRKFNILYENSSSNKLVSGEVMFKN